jgi:hypothetical protein
MNTQQFVVSSKGACKIANSIPDQKSINIILAHAKKKPLQSNAIIIARYQWLIRHKLNTPAEIEDPNLCLTIKNGKLIRAFYANVLTHVIKKLKYSIQVLN